MPGDPWHDLWPCRDQGVIPVGFAGANQPWLGDLVLILTLWYSGCTGCNQLPLAKILIMRCCIVEASCQPGHNDARVLAEWT